MVQKRPFDSEEILELSSKHPKQVESSNRLFSFSESVFPEYAAQHIPHTSEGGSNKGGTEIDQKLASDTFAEHSRSAGYIETTVPGSFSVSSWTTSSTSEEGARSELTVHLPFFPEYFSPERPIRTLARCEEIYSILLEHPPRKLVPVGPGYQADVPVWDSQGMKSTSNQFDMSNAISDSNFIAGDEVEKRLMGTCVIPMPNMGTSEFDGDKVGNGRTDCSCEDGGSVRCVREHILEASEKLVKTIGQEIFMELGLSDMGEQVAEKWSAEEEQLFHEVVFSNPASLGKNFWNNLSIVFPSRTKKEIVSYYFNVFMLRRRAQQNRNDLLNIDSDNDEWQGSDDYGDNELGMQEEDVVVESPFYQGDHCHPHNQENEFQGYDQYAVKEFCGNNGNEGFSCRDMNDDPESPIKKLLDNSASSPVNSMVQLQDGAVSEQCDHEVQNDSCTSSEVANASQVTKVKAENGDHWPGSFNGYD
ncbi:AT-rich interactive domain-containing protein 2 [Quillaja saponaria]|uniref:AT-rich interactive domain-containing protein 2 n=1 Tax=Quillaja saponaria TaxID=32244 RepID=A0AAD7LE27_QUISA|nr:AT-rich interactive domain-containing protein 2 [Quillaja saponaria]